MILLSKLFDPEKTETMLRILQKEFPLAIWETLYVTVIATLFSVIIGLPLGVLIVAGGKNGVFRLPKPVLKILDIVINLLRSIPFLILFSTL